MIISLGQYMAQTGCDVKMGFYAFIWWFFMDMGQMYLNVYSANEEFIERRPWVDGTAGLPKDSHYTVEFEFDSGAKS